MDTLEEDNKTISANEFKTGTSREKDSNEANTKDGSIASRRI